MALSGHPWPWDLANVLGGRARVLFAPTSVAIPVNIDDIFDVDSATYLAQTGWIDFGAAKEGASYSRGFDVEGWEIQQVTGNIVEEVTDTTRSFSVSIAEIKPEHMQIIENAPTIDTVAGAAGKSAQKRLKFGSFTSLIRRRIAVVSQRPLASGTVTQSAAGGSLVRGAFVAFVGYECQIAADEVEFEQTKGELSAASVTFTLFPKSGEASGQEFGVYLEEDRGQTIA